MAYQEYTPERPVRRRTADGQTAAPRKRRRRRRKRIRPDLLILVGVVLVLILALVMPKENQNPTTPTEEPVVTTQPTTIPPTTIPPTTIPPETVPPITIPTSPLTFTEDDYGLLYIRSKSETKGLSDKSEIVKALERKLSWDLQDPSVTVLIIHSHISESYTLNENQVPDESYIFRNEEFRTDDERYNMIAIGKCVAEILQDSGINVIHETQTFEVPNYDYAYSTASKYLEETLKKNPGICLILDLHRDAIQNSDGTQWAPTVTVGETTMAKVSILVGYNESKNTAWNKNLSYAAKLGAQLNHNVPDIFRMLVIADHKRQYNQNFGPVSVIVEIGTAGNSLEEAMNTAEIVAKTVAQLAPGANTK